MHKKNRWRCRIFSGLLVLTLAAGAFPQAALMTRAAGTGKSGLEEIVSQVGESDDTFAPEEGYRLKTRAGKPDSFDLRNVDGTNYVTPVKVQNPYGTCWGFGAIAAAETSIISSGLGQVNDLDLSEKQVAWFNAEAINDRNSPQYGEGMKFADEITTSDKYNIGGVTVFATSLFASGTGPTREDKSTEDGDIYRYKGKKGNVINDKVTWYDESGTEQTGFRRVSYSENDDWTIPEKYRFYQDYSLRESYLLPAPTTVDRNWDVEYHPEATEAIKEQLLSKRAVAINFKSDTYLPGQQGEDHYMSEHWAQYRDDPVASTHVVTIIGYDDNYPKENFKEDCRPPEDGAWLIKNSWGSDLNDFPNNSYRHFGILEGQDHVPYDGAPAKSRRHTGYFWLSYYDNTIRDPETYTFEKAEEGLIIDQHDFMPVSEYEEYATEAENRMANVFTAGQNQRLKDISFMTATPGTKVSYEIYLLPDDAEHPADGECVVSSAPRSYPFGGYHRVTLEEDRQVVLTKGQKYSVVVREQTPGGKYSISFGESSSWERGGRWFESVVNPMESYLYIDGSWMDLSDESIRKILKDEALGMCIDNFSIKAYSEPADNQGGYIDVRRQNGTSAAGLVVKPGDEVKLKATIEGATEELTVQPAITWTSSDPDLLTVEPGSKETEALIRMKTHGTANLIVDAGIYGRSILKITGRKFWLTGGDTPEDCKEMVYTGEELKPEPVNVRGESEGSEESRPLTKDVDYTVSHENNVKCGLADIVLHGIGDFGGELRTSVLDDLSFFIVPAKAKITGIEPGERKLTVSFASQQDTGISGYILSYKETGSTETKTVELGPEAASAVIGNLDPGKTYEVSLKAYIHVLMEEDCWNYDTEQYEDIYEDHYGEESDKVTATVPDKESATTETSTTESAATETGPADTTPAAPTDGSSTDPSTVAGTAKKISQIKKDGDLAGSVYGKLRLRSGKVTKNSIQLKWTKVSGAEGYILYGNLCGTKYKFKKLAEVTGDKGSWTYKKLKKGKYYKFLLVAYKAENMVKKTVTASKTVHIATTGGKVGNHKSVSLKPAKITLKKGKTKKLKATAAAASRKRKVKIHRRIAFESSDKKIAAVGKTGKVTAKKKGNCYIYAYAQNGIYKRVKVTVK